MKKEVIASKLKEIIVNSTGVKEEELILAGEDMIMSLGLNSVDALEILVWIENEFEIQIPDEDLNAGLLKSFDHLVNYISQQKIS